jgi:hypothetical protein
MLRAARPDVVLDLMVLFTFLLLHRATREVRMRSIHECPHTVVFSLLSLARVDSVRQA